MTEQKWQEKISWRSNFAHFYRASLKIDGFFFDVTNNENASAHIFPVDRIKIKDEVAEDIDPQIPPMLPRGIVCKFTFEKMLLMAVILTINF